MTEDEVKISFNFGLISPYFRLSFVLYSLVCIVAVAYA